MNKQTRNEKGFTMIELIVVVAIMGIIGALLVPAFGKMSAKAKLTTDVTTVKTLQRQIDVYTAEQTASPYDAADVDGAKLSVEAVKALADKGYLDTKDLKSSGGGYEVQLKSGGEVKLDTAPDGVSLVLKLDFATATSAGGNGVTDYIEGNVESTDSLAGWISGATFYTP